MNLKDTSDINLWIMKQINLQIERYKKKTKHEGIKTQTIQKNNVDLAK